MRFVVAAAVAFAAVLFFAALANDAYETCMTNSTASADTCRAYTAL